MKHKKHSSLSRPALGQFHRHEWAFIGAPCGNIKKLAFALSEHLQDRCKIGYVDADHSGEQDPEPGLPAGVQQVYTDKIGPHRLDFLGEWNQHHHRQWFNLQDLVLVNGNHFTAQRQIVFIDPRKEASLQKKLDRLTNVAALILAESQFDVYPFLQAHLGEKQIPVFQENDVAGIASWLDAELKAQQAPLFGLVLAGGKSLRMGQDKGAISYHGKPQREYLAELLASVCEKTFLSCRTEQAEEWQSNFPLIPDAFLGLGPFGAILSAFQQYPDAAWVVLACDLPHFGPKHLNQLVNGRNSSKVATSFRSPFDQFPEPLAAIWEPRAYPVLLQFLAQGYSCPRKPLINSDIALLEPEDPQSLDNVNLPEELEAAMGKIEHL
jgi:molybdenum cofactor guanylyltransferase